MSKGQEIGAGLLASVVAIPQCVALGVSAFSAIAPDYPALVQVTGFYSAIIAGFMVAVFGKGQMSMTGPRIGSAIVIAGAAGAFLHADVRTTLSAAALLGLILLTMACAGLIQWLLGRAKLASLQNYVARPVVLGLLLGVAAIMAFKQGVAIVRGDAGFAMVALLTAGLATYAVWVVRNPKKYHKVVVWVARSGPVLAALLGVAAYFALAAQGISAGETLKPINELNILPAAMGGWQAGLSAVAQSRNLIWDVLSAALMLAVVSSIDTTNAYSSTRKKIELDRKLRQSNRSDGNTKIDNTESGKTENNELRWHGLGNFFSALAGGMTSSASEARAAPAIAIGGKGPLAGIAYITGLALLIGLSPIVPWMSAFPMAVVAGLMLQIALVLAYDQEKELRRYFKSWTEIARTSFARWKKSECGSPKKLHVPMEIALNSLAVIAVGLSLAWYDPLRALAIGLLCSMTLFLVKIGQTQRHHCYCARERVSLEMREGVSRELAYGARGNCYVIKLHGDFFFLSRKMVHQMIKDLEAEIANPAKESTKAKAQKDAQAKINVKVDNANLTNAGPWVIVDFDMAHEFDESGIAEISELIGILIDRQFRVLLSYVTSRGSLSDLLASEGVLDALQKQHGTDDYNKYSFSTTERAINFVEDQAAVNADQSVAKTSPPEALSVLSSIPPVTFMGADINDAEVQYWVVLAGKVTLRVPVRYSVADEHWEKVMAEIGPYGVFSTKTLTLPNVKGTPCPGSKVVPLKAEWLATLQNEQPDKAAALFNYLLSQLADKNAMLQREARMLDH